MLGQPVYFLAPDVVGVHMTGRLADGVTATDLALHCTQMLRAAKVVGKFVEFHGEGAASLPLPDRATIANMAPEYGATMGYFPVDEEIVQLPASRRAGPRSTSTRSAPTTRPRASSGCPGAASATTRALLELDLATVRPSVSGPKRPQDRIDLPDLKEQFRELLRRRSSENGYGKTDGELASALPRPDRIRRDRCRKRRCPGGGHQDTTRADPAPGARGRTRTRGPRRRW